MSNGGDRGMSLVLDLYRLADQAGWLADSYARIIVKQLRQGEALSEWLMDEEFRQRADQRDLRAAAMELARPVRVRRITGSNHD